MAAGAHISASGRTRGAGSSGLFALEPVNSEPLGVVEGGEQNKLDLETKVFTPISSFDLVASGLDFSHHIFSVIYFSIFSNMDFCVYIFCNMDFWFSVRPERLFFVRYHGPEGSEFHGVSKYMTPGTDHFLILFNSTKLFSVIIM